MSDSTGHCTPARKSRSKRRSMRRREMGPQILRVRRRKRARRRERRMKRGSSVTYIYKHDTYAHIRRHTHPHRHTHRHVDTDIDNWRSWDRKVGIVVGAQMLLGR